MIGSSSIVDTIINPLVFSGGRVDGYISSRLMAAYNLDGDHVIQVAVDSIRAGRIQWHYILEHNHTVVFEGFDLSTAVVETYGDAARTALNFLTLGEHDTDDEYFAGYTAEQIAWRDEHAEDLSLYALGDND
jgi:hypothetical protein